MAKIKFTIHPLFLAFGIYFALTGRVYSFLIFTLCAVVHEMGHSLVASQRGYKLKRIVLMPYGAIVFGDNDDMSYGDEATIALAGPFVSLTASFIFVSFWWLIPDLYPYTETCVLANLTIATVNMLPAYPLDGGRVLLSVLSCCLKRKTAIKICKAIGLVFSLLVLAFFIYSLIIKQPNFSVLFFASFMFFGNFFVSKDLKYEKIKGYFTLGNLKRGKKVNVIAVSDDVTVKELKQRYKFGELTLCYVYDKMGDLLYTLRPHEVVKIISSENLYSTVASVYKKER